MNKLKCLFLSGLMAVMPVCMSGQQTPGEKSSKPRVIITCDPELDDLNSLIRFLLFSTDFRVEGLIYASSQFHWKGDVGIRMNVSLTMLWKLMRKYIPI